MAWTTPPADVAALKDMLDLCPTWSGASISCHYPEAVPPGSTGADATYPYAVLASMRSPRVRFAEGAGGLASGQVTIVLHTTSPASTVEPFARTVLRELHFIQTGLFISDTDVELASDPTPGQRADADEDASSPVTTITMTVSYGLSAP